MLPKHDNRRLMSIQRRFVSTLVSAALLDRVGRRPLLIISAIGSSVGMVSIGAFFYLKEVGSAEVRMSQCSGRADKSRHRETER